MKSNLGQFFTTNSELQAACVAFCRNAVKGKTPILEPSAGQGDLIAAMHAAYPHAPTHAVEIDPDLPPVHTRSSKDKWVCADFIKTAPPRKSYRTIIGNPPYVRQGPTNLYLQFIERCITLLSKGGELVFVLPSDFFKLTGAAPLIQSMCAQGAFTDMYRPDSERLFAGATIDVMVIRYEKRPGLPHVCRDFCTGTPHPYSTDGGIITFQVDSNTPGTCLGDVATVHVGLVSGCEDVYASDEHGNTSILVSENEVRRYVVPAGALDPVVEGYLVKHKDRLLARRIRTFNETNWFEWGALRNVELMQDRAGEDCVYVSTLKRKGPVAFKGKVMHFGAGLLCVLPKKGSNINLEALTEHLNSAEFRSQYTYSGRFKMGQRLLQFASVHIPMPMPLIQA